MMINNNTVQIKPESRTAIDLIVDPTFSYNVSTRTRKGKNELGEWVYNNDMINEAIKNGFITLDEITNSTGTTHYKLDRRYIDTNGNANVSVLIEVKGENNSEFSEEEIKQLFSYVKLEQYYRKGAKIIAIIYNIETGKMRIWKIVGNDVIELNDTQLKSFEEYVTYFNMKIDYNNNRIEVLKNATELNRKLHNLGIKENLRCQFVALIMLAMKNGLQYAELDEGGNILKTPYSTGQIIGKADAENSIVNILNVIKMTTTPDLDLEKITAILSLDVIKNMKTCDFCDLLNYIQQNIMRFIDVKSNEGLDILSHFFLVFLKYVNREDKNQAFTPGHIATFMAKVGDVKKDSVVLDPTCGAGTFLISALNLALKNCETEEECIEAKNNMYGIEVDENVFKLATSNMLIHSGGYSKVNYGSCFEKKTVKVGDEVRVVFDRKKWIHNIKPDVILMNPPYNASKAQIVGADFEKYYDSKAVTDPLKGLGFVEEIADAAGRGTLIVLLPQQCAIGNSSKILACKERILKNHTLDAVFSMPNDLFYPGASAVVCCMVFKLGVPHSDDKETFLGFYKEDGFEKRKHLGRIDVRNTWESIENEWLRLYKNRKSVCGRSVTKQLNAKDEWCAEAHMQTDYSVLTDDFFEKTIRNYLSFQIQNEK